jgi:hypothetical protein
MHIFVYPEKDTYITNDLTYVNKNFGIDEILELKAIPQLTRVLNSYVSLPFNGFFSQSFINYSGSIIGGISGKDKHAIIYVSGSSYFSSSRFNGGLSGSYNGGAVALTNFSDASGHFSGSVTGSITGSFTGSFCYASGTLMNFNGSLNGQLSGTADVYQPYYSYVNDPDLSRVLLKFDLSSISKSIIEGDIDTNDIKFYLKLKATEAVQVPVNYTIYAYPVSQSWTMGTGRYAYGGDSIGVSWNHRTNSNSDFWSGTGSANAYYTSSDYLTVPSLSSASFQNEGGTWYYSVPTTYVQPTSSVKTLFYNTASSTPTFETQYSSSLNTNLTSSFSGLLSGSLNSVVSSSFNSSSIAYQNYVFLNQFASNAYTTTSASVSESLSSLDTSVLNNTVSGDVYNSKYSSSLLFLESLSSSIQSVLQSSTSLATYTTQSYQYILSLSSSVAPSTIYSELYSIINNLVTASISASISSSNNYNTYYGFYTDLVSDLSSNYWYSSSACSCSLTEQTSSISASLLNSEYLSYLSSSVSSSIISSSLIVANNSFSSSILNYFSSSVISYFNNGIENIKTITSASVVSSLTQKFAAKFCNIPTGSSLICSQSFNYQSSDLNVDVTDIVKGWICGCVPNEGFILLTSLELSNIDNVNGTIKFFSKESNTIYSPYLDIAYDDSEYITGSLVSLNTFNPYTVVVKNLNRSYKFGSVIRINVFAREKSPLKNFVKGYQQSQYLSSSLLPSDTYFAIKDNNSENMILDFDEYTKLSCDGSIHYFNLDTTTLPVERYYRILIKTIIDGETKIFDNNIFTITR